MCRESGDNQGEKLLEVRKNFFKKGKEESIGWISGKLFFFLEGSDKLLGQTQETKTF